VFPTPVADPRNSSYYLGKASGTSMAAPQVTGILALIGEYYNKQQFNQAKARQLLFNYASKPNQIPTSSGGITDVYDLLGAPNRYLNASTEITAIGSTATWVTQELETKEGYTTDSEVIYGLTRIINDQIQEFVFIPMQINLPPEQETGVGTLSISINYVTPQAIALIRKYLTEPVRVTIELVLGSSPEYTEALFDNFWITSATYSAQSISLQLDMVSFSREPFPSFTFSPTYFPGLF
jgi:subtilisin family serine protease